MESKRSMATSMRITGSRRWIELLAAFVKNHNREFLPGQKKLRRIDIDETNWLEAVAAIRKTGDADPSLMFHISRASDLPPAAEAVTWRYKIGDKVLLSREVDFSIAHKRGHFEKSSVVGSFGDKVYTVDHRDYHLSKDNHLIPTYKLRELDDGQDLLYETDLRPALYAEDETEAVRRARNRRLLAARRRKKKKQTVKKQ